MGMSSYVMDCEEQFIEAVSARIGGCEQIEELYEALVKDRCFLYLTHMCGAERQELISELWNEYWSNHV